MHPGDMHDPDATVPSSGHPRMPANPHALAPGAVIGRYTLIRFIDAGGMGEVWEAEREDPFRHKVALKVMSIGRAPPREAMARFEQEREVLAALSHEHIATILDGGVHAGRPWFAMEFVDGEPITEYCDRHGLGLRERLAVFRQVCEAVSHAHRRGIIHRDLKPSNVLVSTGTDGRPVAKVIDFGIAKAMSGPLKDRTALTVEHRPIGTFEYMSPEQADPGPKDVDTRTDVYSLGVVLYELLAGVKPFDMHHRAEQEARRIVLEEDAPTPSLRLSTVATRDAAEARRISRGRREELGRLIGVLRSELEWIPLKAIRKDRERRYRSADEFSEDIGNYLEGKALLAAPESRTYRASKFVRRHRVAIGTASAIAAALAVGLAAALWQWREASLARDEAELISEFQAEMLSEIDTVSAGIGLTEGIRARVSAELERTEPDGTARSSRIRAFEAELAGINGTDIATDLIDSTILQPALRAIDERFASNIRVSSRLREAVALVYATIGRLDDALALQERALADAREAFGDDSPQVLRGLDYAGTILVDMGRPDKARPYCEEALSRCRRRFGDEHRETLQATVNMAVLLGMEGRDREAEVLFRHALDGQRRLFGEDGAETVNTKRQLGKGLLQGERPWEGLALLEEVLAVRLREHGELHAESCQSLADKAEALAVLGRPEDAEPLARRWVAASTQLRGERHPMTLSGRAMMARLARDLGRSPEARAEFERIEADARQALGANHWLTLGTGITLGHMLADDGDLEAADRKFASVLSSLRRHADTDEDLFRRALLGRVQVLTGRGRISEAIVLADEVLESIERSTSPDRTELLFATAEIAVMVGEAGDPGAAATMLSGVLDRLRRIHDPRHPSILALSKNLGYMLEGAGRVEDAERTYREVLPAQREALGDAHETTVITMQNLGLLLWRKGEPREAAELLGEAAAAADPEAAQAGSGRQASADVRLNVRSNLGVVLRSLGRLPEAEGSLRRALAIARDMPSSDGTACAETALELAEVLLEQRSFAAAAEVLEAHETAARNAFGTRSPDSLVSYLTARGRALAGGPFDHDRFVRAGAVLEQAAGLAADSGSDGEVAAACIRALAELHAAWDEAEPGKGHGAEAAEWKGLLEDSAR